LKAKAIFMQGSHWGGKLCGPIPGATLNLFECRQLCWILEVK
jgi:hypothetical protein